MMYSTAAACLFIFLVIGLALYNTVRLSNASTPGIWQHWSSPTSTYSYARSAWHKPVESDVDDLGTILNKTGVYGFIFNSSDVPESTPYSSYNWCNMPHVRAKEYPRANSSFTLQYVEVIHRHHKRTPYAANAFPVESYGWDCSDAGLVHAADLLPVDKRNGSARTYWSGYKSTSNPFHAPGFPGDCQFPQITSGGLFDSRKHGQDLASVYIDLLEFLPPTYDENLVSFHVTNNQITSQVASEVIPGLYPELASGSVPLKVQAASIDSLEPRYPCPAASSLQKSYTSEQKAGPWRRHLTLSAPLFAQLDAVSGVPSSAADWHESWDHYFDNLSARLCHDKPLPCSVTNSSLCISQAQADAVFRLGEWEYSYIWRAAGPQTLAVAAASYGVFVAELAEHLQSVTQGKSVVKYRHNVAHDGSLSRLLALLQVDRMVWPGMGSEVVFELFSRANDGEWFVRVLWSGQIMTSSSPLLGKMDIVPLHQFLAYFDDYIFHADGEGGPSIQTLC